MSERVVLGREKRNVGRPKKASKPPPTLGGASIAEDASRAVKLPKIRPIKDRDPALFVIDSEFVRTIPLWADRWGSEQLLAARDDMTPREFDRGFRQKPISDQDLVFKPDVLDQCKDSTFCMIDHIEPGSIWDSALRYAGVDLAISESEQAAYFVVTIIAVDRNQQRWILWIERHRGVSLNKQFEILIDLQFRFNPLNVKVENNAYQKSLERHIQEYNQSTDKVVHIPVTGYTTTALTKHDEEFGVPSLGIEFEQRRWHIPVGDARSQRLVEPLLDEMSVFPLPGYLRDVLMSLFFARECHQLQQVPRGRIIDLAS